MTLTKKVVWAAGWYLLWAAVAWAGAPVPFDAYTVSNGVITAPCPAAAISCSGTVADNGFLQRQVKTATGTYIQFILTDPGVAGDAAAAPFTAARGSLNFTNEDFVQMNNRTTGIASKQSLFESDFSTPTTEDRFETVTQYLFGWAQDSPEPWVDVHQAISTLDYTNPLSPTETFTTAADIISSNTSFSTDQDIGLYQYVNLGDTDAQKFQYKEVSGIYQLTAHPSTGPTPLLPGGTNGGDFTWVLGNKLAAVWVGQSLADADAGVFGYTHYQKSDNADNPIAETGYSTLANPNPVNWLNPPFDAVDNISSVPTVSPTAVVAPPVLPTGTGETATIPSGSPDPLGPPTTFGQWTINNGDITASFLPGSPVDVSGKGLLQRIVTIGGDQYIQTVVADTTATGNPNAAPFTAGALGFSNESFVKMGETDPSDQGVASTLHIEEQNLAYKTTTPSTPLPTDGGQFTYNALVNTGWANGSPVAPTVEVHQRNYVPDNQPPTTTSFYQSFDMKVGGNDSDDRDIHISSVTGTDALSDSTLPLSLIGGAGNCGIIGGTVSGTNCVIAGTGFVKPIMFDTHILKGIYQTSSHLLTDPPLLPAAGATNGGNIAWAPGESIQATYVGGQYTTSDPAGDEIISASSFTNLSTGQRTANADRTTPSPVLAITGVPTPTSTSWDEYFGPAPVYSSPFVPPP